MWWWYDRRTPARELGFASGPMPDLALPRALAPSEQFSRREILGGQPVIGGTGEGANAGIGATAPASAAPASSQPGGRLPGGIPAGVISAGVSLAIRAAGLPGIVASIINLIVGPAVRRALSPGAPGGGTFDNDLGIRGPVGESGPEPPSIGGASLADVIRSREGTPDDEGGGLAMPGPTSTAVGEDQALPAGLDTEGLDVYGDAGGFVLDTPGPAFPGGDGVPV